MKHEPRYYRPRPQNEPEARSIGEILKPVVAEVYRRHGK